MSLESDRPEASPRESGSNPTEGNQQFAVEIFAKTSRLSSIHFPATGTARQSTAVEKTPKAAGVWRIGRVGALAVMLGVGAAIAAVPGVAAADTSDASSPESSTQRTQESTSTKKPGSPAGRSSKNAAGRNEDSTPSRAVSTPAAESSASSDHRRDEEVTVDDRDSSGAARSNSTQKNSDDTDAPRASQPTRNRQLTSTKLRNTSTPVTSPAVTTPPGDPAAPARSLRDSILLALSSSTRRPDDSTAEATSSSPGATNSTAQPQPLATVESQNTSAGSVDGVVIEAETLTLSRSGRGTTYLDPTASGGTALVLKQNSSASTTVSLPEFTGVVVRARGDQYRGAPVMNVSINGKVVSSVAVTATSWTDYTVPFSAPAGRYTVSVAYTNDASGKLGDRNLRLDKVTVVKAAADPPPPPPPSTSTPGFFNGADWLWNPIPANAQLAGNSATWVSYLAAANKARIANLYDYSVALVSASDVSSGTPRYDVNFTQPWGSDPFGSATVPIPIGTKVPPGTDGHVAVLDPTTGTAFGIWQAKYDTATNKWSGSWGGITSLTGNGIDTSGSATAAAIARYAGVVTAAEFSTALAANTGINHALAFSTDIAGPDFVYPAAKSDGQNWAGVAVPLPEGYRIQLDPAIDVDAISGMTPGERVIAKTLQTHGAYVVDQGAARMAFAFELLDDATSTSPGSVWVNAGFAWDYYNMSGIPWSQLRVLAPTAVTA